MHLNVVQASRLRSSKPVTCSSEMLLPRGRSPDTKIRRDDNAVLYSLFETLRDPGPLCCGVDVGRLTVPSCWVAIRDLARVVRTHCYESSSTASPSTWTASPPQRVKPPHQLSLRLIVIMRMTGVDSSFSPLFPPVLLTVIGLMSQSTGPPCLRKRLFLNNSKQRQKPYQLSV